MDLPSLLAHYPAIGWDLDGTLIDHPASEVLHAIIKAHPEKRHVIVTFRTHGLRRRIAHDLSVYASAPPMSSFVEVHSIDDERWERFEMARMQRRAGMLRGPLTEDEAFYVEWKGMVCRDLGLPVLVDDNTDHTKPGCDRYGVDLLHPDQFT